MKNEKLLQYIASLSDEDRVKYKDLIEESLPRDMMLTQNFTASTTCLEYYCCEKLKSSSYYVLAAAGATAC